MARFLALFASSNVTLFDPFCVIFCLLEERSMAGPWAFVLNISSNSFRFCLSSNYFEFQTNMVQYTVRSFVCQDIFVYIFLICILCSAYI